MPTAQALTLTSQCIIIIIFLLIKQLTEPLLRVAILLEALSIPYNVKLWEFGDASNGVKGPNFTKINENGRVPAIGKLHSAGNPHLSWFLPAVVYISRSY